MAVVGLMLGSFATVLIHRLPRNEKFVKGRSQCPSCKELLAPIDLIPVITWLFLRGRCRHCKARISIKYPLIELTSCFIAVSVINQHGASIASVVLALTCIGLGATATIDALTQRLPNRAIITIAIFELIGFFADALVNDSWQDFKRGAIVAILATGVALVFYFVSRGGLGEGDVKFAPIDLIPVFTWLFLLGRCRHCKVRISFKYPLIELTSCLIAVSVINQHGASIASVVLAISCIGLAATATIDALTRRLPNRAIITIAIFELIGFFADAVVNDSWQDLKRAALVAILATGVALIFYFVSRGGLGEGDVKFTPIVWLPLGWLGWGAAFGAYLIAAVIAVLWTVVFGIMQRRIRKVSIPLGPALALGAIITIIADFSWKAGV